MWTLPRIGAGNKIGEGPRETRRKSLRRQNFMAPGNNLPASSKGKERRVIREMAVLAEAKRQAWGQPDAPVKCCLSEASWGIFSRCVAPDPRPLYLDGQHVPQVIGWRGVCCSASGESSECGRHSTWPDTAAGNCLCPASLKRGR